MLSFARKSESGKKRHDLALLLDKAIDLIRNDYDLAHNYDFRKIAVVRDYHPDVPPVLCEETRIIQVFLNLLKNAAEAMHGPGPTAGPPGFVLRVRREGTLARVDIEDNGPGMEEAVRRRIFEPFFTTKEVHRGMGLGLSVSYFIITRDHGGEMEVASAPGRGTVFTIRLQGAGEPSGAGASGEQAWDVAAHRSPGTA
jgi:signal transduction histidine kinase